MVDFEEECHNSKSTRKRHEIFSDLCKGDQTTLTSRRHDSWMKALGRDPTREHLVEKNCVCLVHFREEDTYVVNNKIRLKSDAIPRLHLRKPFLPTFQTIHKSTSGVNVTRKTSGVNVTRKPGVQFVEQNPQTSCHQQADEYLPRKTSGVNVTRKPSGVQFVEQIPETSCHQQPDEYLPRKTSGVNVTRKPSGVQFVEQIPETSCHQQPDEYLPRKTSGVNVTRKPSGVQFVEQIPETSCHQQPDEYLPRKTSDVNVTRKPGVQFVEQIPETSCHQQPDKYLPRNTSQTEDITNSPTEKRNHGGEVFCRMCLETIHERNKMVPLTLTHINFASESARFKLKKTMEYFKITSMIQIVMPDFDFKSVYNPLACHKCVARLESAYKFIRGSEENEIIIQRYKSKYCPDLELVLCEDVAQNKSLQMEEISPEKKPETLKTHDSIDSVSGSPFEESGRQLKQSGNQLEQRGSTGLASDITQADRYENVNTSSSASQGNLATETSFEFCSSIKCETEDIGDYGGGGDSHFLLKTEEMSYIVKEETVVQEDVTCDFNDTPINEQIAYLDMDYHVKDEHRLQPDALSMSDFDDYY